MGTKTVNLLEREIREAKAEVTARAGYELSEDNSRCPVCAKPMPVLDAAGVPARVCVEDRVALPVKD